VADGESGTLLSLSVALASAQTGDLLAADTSGTNISAEYDSAAGVLTLSGVDSLANYQQVLGSVTYDNTNGNPGVNFQTIRVTANDGKLASTDAVASVHVVLLPVITAALADDSGVDPTDGVTNDDLIAGAVGSALSTIVSLQAQVDSGTVQVVPFDPATGHFVFDPQLATDGSADGPHSVRFEATDANGDTGSSVVPFTLATLPPAVTVALQNDTGIYNDRITYDPTIIGTVHDPTQLVTFVAGMDDSPEQSFVDISTLVNPDGSYTLSASLMDQIAGGQLSEGAHVLHLVALDKAGNRTTLDFSFTYTLLTTPPIVPDFQLSPDSLNPTITAPDTTDATEVTLVGMTSPNVMVYLEEAGQAVSSDGSGYFQFSGVMLSPGENLFTVIAIDAGGNFSYTQRTIICTATSNPTPP
jgi:hypothetical protein